MLYVAAATLVPATASVIPDGESLQTAFERLASEGSGLTVIVIVRGSPWQPAALTGTTVYTTSTGELVVFVQASSAMEEDGRPEPEDGSPAEAVSPFALIEVIL